MKKFLLLLVMLGMCSLMVSAGSVTGAAEYAGSNAFNQVKARVLWQPSLNFTAGVEGKWAKEDAFKAIDILFAPDICSSYTFSMESPFCMASAERSVYNCLYRFWVDAPTLHHVMLGI